MDFTNRDYTVWFNGTSAACHVAGVAALVLSVNSSLTQLQVRNYIETTCDKLSGYIYTSKPIPEFTYTINREYY